MKNESASRFERYRLSPLALSLLPGICRCASSIEVAGVHLPAWLGFGLIVVVCAILARLAMRACGLNDELLLQLLVCIWIGLFIAAFAWIAWAGF